MKATEQYFPVVLCTLMYKVVQTFEYVLLTFDSVDETPFSILLELAKFVGFVVRIATYLVKFGYMVESRSIIFSKLLEGLALSTAAAATGAAAAALGAAAAAATAVARPVSVGLSPLTAAAAAATGPAGAAPATGPPAGATAGALGRGGSEALDVGVLLSTGGWG